MRKTKVCLKCGKRKVLEKFPFNNKCCDNRNSYCRKCHSKLSMDWGKRNKEKKLYHEYLFHKRHPERRYLIRIKSWYGITRNEYTQLRKVQKECCAICGKQRRIDVDHDHTTNKVRGLLCVKCNAGLGLLGDNITGLQRALKYLEKAAT